MTDLRIAVLSDIHGNIHALDAVLAEVESARPDAIVVCGDVAAGPFPSETIERLRKLSGPVHFVRGNADREFVAAFDERMQLGDVRVAETVWPVVAWGAMQIDPVQRDFLASFAERVTLEAAGLGRTVFCHGTPRSDTEIITQRTPEAELERLLAGTDGRVVVCGHTHHQFDRQAAGYRVINPGSVGMAYQGEPGAFWAMLGPAVEFRRTEYDFDLAVEQAEATGYPESAYRETILTPPSADEVAERFERVAADRGERKSFT